MNMQVYILGGIRGDVATSMKISYLGVHHSRSLTFLVEGGENYEPRQGFKPKMMVRYGCDLANLENMYPV